MKYFIILILILTSSCKTPGSLNPAMDLPFSKMQSLINDSPEVSDKRIINVGISSSGNVTLATAANLKSTTGYNVELQYSGLTGWRIVRVRHEDF